MSPASETRTSAWSTKPANHCKECSTCQGSGSERDSLRSGAIFLLNWESPHRERLTTFLRSLRYQVFVPEEHGKTAHDLCDEELLQADLVIFAFGRPTHELWSEFRRVCGARKNGMPLRVIVWLQGYRDAVLHLMLEKLADRIVYAHE